MRYYISYRRIELVYIRATRVRGLAYVYTYGLYRYEVFAI
jgi:hypothetical protein